MLGFLKSPTPLKASKPTSYPSQLPWDGIAHMVFRSSKLPTCFVIFSLQAGMDVLLLQAMLRHASLDILQHYAQMIDEDLLQAHQAHSPIDNLSRLR
jgi:hypothetical protein